MAVLLGCCLALPSWCCIGFSTDLFRVGWLVYRCPQVMSYHGYNFGDGTQKVGLHQRSVGTCSFLKACISAPLLTALWAGIQQRACRKSCSFVTQSSLCLRSRSAPLILLLSRGVLLGLGLWLSALFSSDRSCVFIGPPCACCVFCDACGVFAHVLVWLWSCVMCALFVLCTLCVLMWSSLFLLSGFVLCFCSVRYVWCLLLVFRLCSRASLSRFGDQTAGGHLFASA